MSSSTMETVPGGESTQYESIKTVTEPTQKQEGQLGGASATSAQQTTNPTDVEKGEKTAENIRYGQNISESGMGGKTTDVEGEAQQGGYGGTHSQEQDGELENMRRAQGHGSMPNIGA